MRLPGFTAEASIYSAIATYVGFSTRSSRPNAAPVAPQLITFPTDSDYWGRLASLMARCPPPFCTFDLATGHCYCRTALTNVGGPNLHSGVA
jgi:hypothetical protein